MNRNLSLFGLSIIIFVIIISFGFNSCESRSKRLQSKPVVKVINIKMVLVKFETNGGTGNLYKVRLIPYDSITHFAYVDKMYSVGDTVKRIDALAFK